MEKIVEYRRYDPIPEPVYVAVDAHGEVFDLEGKPWSAPAEKMKLREIITADEWELLHALHSTKLPPAARPND